MSTISSGTTLTTALVQTGDTTGDLVIRTGSSNTTAMTISGTDQSVTLAGSLTANTNASTITTGTVPTARLATGTANSSTYLRGDQTWAAIASSQWVTSGSNISYTTGNVGIGTASPTNFASATTLTVNNAGDGVVNTQSNGTDGLRIGSGSSSSYLFEARNLPMRFLTNAAERMRIDSSGNVGIGTSSPLGTLGISGSATATIVIPRSSNGTTASPVETQLIASTFTNGTFGAGIFALNSFNDTSANFLTFKTTATGNGSPTERMRITSDGLLQFNSGYGSVATAYGCRAWVNFNGTGTIAIRGSGNISSVGDLGAGFYQPNFTTAMPDVNYAVAIAGAGARDGSGGNDSFNIRSPTTNYIGAASVTTGYVQTSHKDAAGANVDADVVTVTIFR